MRKLSNVLLLGMIMVLLSACVQYLKSNQEPHKLDFTPTVAISIEEAKTRIPFDIKQPVVPFQVSEKSARILKTNGKYDAVELTYVNTEEELNLMLLITNSKSRMTPSGQKGQRLSNGAQVWEKSSDLIKAIFWRNEGLTYTLFSGKHNTFDPLYDFQALVDIANTIK